MSYDGDVILELKVIMQPYRVDVITQCQSMKVVDGKEVYASITVMPPAGSMAHELTTILLAASDLLRATLADAGAVNIIATSVQ